jgi:D-cysteine desulfhydrase
MIPNEPERVSLSHLPTPIRRLKKLTAMFGGPELYVKRDDLTGVGLSGNKVRKLEYLVADAQRKGADTLITCGGVQSNHARATAIAGAQNNMRSVLVLRGESETPYDGNVLLDKMVAAEIKLVTPEQYAQQIDEIMEEVAQELRDQGHLPYVIPEGGSNPIGVWGYIRASVEIKGQLEKMDVKVDTITCAVGSGGTQAGLLVGGKLCDLGARVVGFNVCDTARYFKTRIGRLVAETIERYSLPVQVSPDELVLVDGYVGRGYALSRPEELELIKTVAHQEGIFLDPVYTGKALFGLADQIRQGRFKKGERVLFVHTGGIYGLFAREKREGLFPGKA